MRIQVDLGKQQEPLSSFDCHTCSRPTTPIGTQQNTMIWYCQACDVFHETTFVGVWLRSFRKEPNQIVVSPERDDGIT